jgi:hypothetical protein
MCELRAQLHSYILTKEVQSDNFFREQWVLHVMFPSACSYIVCWFPLSFTTCFGLHGHLQAYKILHIFKGSASLLEDGHVGRKHVVKDSGNQHTIKLHAGGNITCNTHWTIQCSRVLKYSIIGRERLLGDSQSGLKRVSRLLTFKTCVLIIKTEYE